MKMTFVAMGNKMPLWVEIAVKDFSHRLQEHCALNIIEIPLVRRGKSSDISRIMEKEASLMATAIPQQARVIALDIKGASFNSEQLAKKLENLQQVTSHVCFLIGGPEGLSPQLVARSEERWSLSQLTLPHPIVRIVLLEALYRACSIMQNHPYHK